MNEPVTEAGRRLDCIETTWKRDAAGYGIRQIAGQRWRAHRYVWTMVHGPIPDGMVICHACDNPPCVNVAHLWIGTPSQNTLDRHAKGRDAVGDRNGSRTHPERRPHGNGTKPAKFGAQNGHAKLTDDQVREIRARGATEKHLDLARQYGVGESAIYRILSRRSWPHV